MILVEVIVSFVLKVCIKSKGEFQCVCVCVCSYLLSQPAGKRVASPSERKHTINHTQAFNNTQWFSCRLGSCCPPGPCGIVGSLRESQAYFRSKNEFHSTNVSKHVALVLHQLRSAVIMSYEISHDAPVIYPPLRVSDSRSGMSSGSALFSCVEGFGECDRHYWLRL